MTALGLMGAWLAPQLVTTLGADGRPVTPGIAAFTSVVLLGLLMAAQAGVGALREAGTLPRAVVGVLGVLAVISVAVTSLMWLTPRTVAPAELESSSRTNTQARTTDGDQDAGLEDWGSTSLIHPAGPRAIPATAADQGLSRLATRTLVIERTEGGLAVSLVSGAGTTLDHLSGATVTRTVTGPLSDPQPARPDPADEQLRTLAAQLTAGTALDPRPALESFGAAFVVLRDEDGGEAATAAAVDAVPGLSSVGLTDSGWLWRVVPAQDGGVPVAGDHGLADRRGFTAARVRIEDAAGTTTHLVAGDAGRVDTPVGPATAGGSGADAGGADAEDPGTGRLLVLAERADPGWRATFDGVPLDPVTHDDWAQAFELPAEGGRLQVWHEAAGASWAWWAGGVLVVLAALLAIPSPARRADVRSGDRCTDAGTADLPEAAGAGTEDYAAAWTIGAPAAPARDGRSGTPDAYAVDRGTDRGCADGRGEEGQA